MQVKTRTQKRIYSFDVIRIVAAVAVVLVHSIAFMVSESPYGGFEFTFANFLDSLGRTSVTLFLMLSGALLLNEKRQISTQKCLKSALHLVLVCIFWSALYAFLLNILTPIVEGKEILLEEFFEATIKGHFHLWYIYMLAGLYLITPVLRLFVKRENVHMVVYFLLLGLFVQSLPIFLDVFLDRFTGLNQFTTKLFGMLEFNYINDYLGCYLAGWVVTNIRIPKKHRLVLYAVGFAGFLVTFLGTQFFLSEDMRKSVFYDHDKISLTICGIAIFVFIHHLFKNKSFEKTGKLVVTLSNLTFGVYLIHCFGLIFIRYFTEDIPSGMLRLAIEFPFALVFSFGVTYIISKIPYLKRMVST